MTLAPAELATAQTAAIQRPNDDRSLVDAILGGDQEALRTAYDRYAGFVNGVALGILKDRDLAADITQEVFVRLWQRGDRFQSSRGSLKAYLKVDAHGRAIDLLRSRIASSRRERNDQEKQWSTHTPGTEELAMAAVVSDTVQSALLELPETQRDAIAMAYFDGYSYREVANRLGVPEGTVKSRIRIGLRRLQAVLGEEAA